MTLPSYVNNPVATFFEQDTEMCMYVYEKYTYIRIVCDTADDRRKCFPWNRCSAFLILAARFFIIIIFLIRMEVMITADDKRKNGRKKYYVVV